MILVILKIWCKFHLRECPTEKPDKCTNLRIEKLKGNVS